MIYGHIDKQNYDATMWDEGLSPTNPVVRDGKAYGRGVSDDGYVTFAVMTAILAARD